MGRVTRHTDSSSHSPSRIYTRRMILLDGWSVSSINRTNALLVWLIVVSVYDKFYPEIKNTYEKMTEKQNPEKGVSNGPIQFKSARKIWPLLELLAKFRSWVLAYSCSQNLASARMLGFSFNLPYVKIEKLWGKMRALWMFLETCILVLLTFYWNWRT